MRTGGELKPGREGATLSKLPERHLCRRALSLTNSTSQPPVSEETLRVCFDGSLHKTDKDPSCFSSGKLSHEEAHHEGSRKPLGYGRKDGPDEGLEALANMEALSSWSQHGLREKGVSF